MSHFDQLPEHLIQAIQLQLDVEDRKNVSLLNSSWREVFKQKTCLEHSIVKIATSDSVEGFSYLLSKARHLQIVLPKESHPSDGKGNVQLFAAIYNIVQHCPALYSIKLHHSKYESYSNCTSPDRVDELFELARHNLSTVKVLRCKPRESITVTASLTKFLSACSSLRELDITVTKYDTTDTKTLLASLPNSIRQLIVRPKAYPNRLTYSYVPIIRAFVDLADRGVHLSKLYFPVGLRELYDVALPRTIDELLSRHTDVRLEVSMHGCGCESAEWFVGLTSFLASVKNRLSAADVRMSDQALHVGHPNNPTCLLESVGTENLEWFSWCLLTIQQFDGASAGSFATSEARMSLKRLLLDCPLSGASSLVSRMANLRVLQIRSSMQGSWKRVENYAWKDDQLLGQIANSCPLLEVLVTDEIARISVLSNSNEKQLQFPHLRKLDFPADCSLPSNVQLRICAPALRCLKIAFVNENFAKSTVGQMVNRVFRALRLSSADMVNEPPPHLALWRIILDRCPNVTDLGVLSSKALYNLPEWWTAVSALKYLHTLRIRSVRSNEQAIVEQIENGVRSCKSLRCLKVRGRLDLKGPFQQSTSEIKTLKLLTL